MRADARRNRERIEFAALDAFARFGLAAQMDDIARAAGVGVGTLYRHFPTKEALIEAIIAARIAPIIDGARALAASATPGAAFFDYMTQLFEEQGMSRDCMEAVGNAAQSLKLFSPAVWADLRDALQTLLVRAQAAGAVRRDIDVDELITLLSCAFTATDADGGGQIRRKVWAIVSDGLRHA